MFIAITAFVVAVVLVLVVVLACVGVAVAVGFFLSLVYLLFMLPLWSFSSWLWLLWFSRSFLLFCGFQGWLKAHIFKPLPGKVDNISSRLLEIIEEQEQKIVSQLFWKKRFCRAIVPSLSAFRSFLVGIHSTKRTPSQLSGMANLIYNFALRPKASR